MTRLLRDKWNIVQKVSALEQPQLNPLHDCTGPLLKDAMAQTVREKQADWDDFLDAVLFLFRMSINPTTKFSPYSLMFNRKPSLPNQVQNLSLVREIRFCHRGLFLITGCASFPVDDFESAE